GCLREFALARYNGSGSLDPSFGTGGEVLTDLGGQFWGGAHAVALQPDGRIVVGGDGALARYNANGALDTGFGAGGAVLMDFATAFGNAVALQPDGRIVTAGRVSAAGIGSDDIAQFTLARYNANGALDTAFGTGGHVTTDFGSDTARFAAAAAVSVQPDGRIVAAGGFYANAN